MNRRPKIKITLIDRKGPNGCHRGHKVGDSYDFDTQRGELCPMAMHVDFSLCGYPAVWRKYSGQERNGSILCPDVDTINVFKIEMCEDE